MLVRSDCTSIGYVWTSTAMATAVKGSNTVTAIASRFPRSYSYGHCYAYVEHWYACVVMMYPRMRCVYSVYVCACVRVCPCETHASARLFRVGKDTQCRHILVIILRIVYLNGVYISVHWKARPVFAQLQIFLFPTQLQALVRYSSSSISTSTCSTNS